VPGENVMEFHLDFIILCLFSKRLEMGNWPQLGLCCYQAVHYYYFSIAIKGIFKVFSSILTK